MLCILFGAMIAALSYGWIGDWVALAGAVAGAALYLTMRYWPVKPSS